MLICRRLGTTPTDGRSAGRQREIRAARIGTICTFCGRYVIEGSDSRAPLSRTQMAPYRR